jgi:hypothetical protein
MEVKMAKIIFKRLTVKEEERVIAGNNSSNNVSGSNFRKCDSNVDKRSVGSGCLIVILTTNKKICHAVINQDLRGTTLI